MHVSARVSAILDLRIKICAKKTGTDNVTLSLFRSPQEYATTSCFKKIHCGKHFRKVAFSLIRVTIDVSVAKRLDFQTKTHTCG